MAELSDAQAAEKLSSKRARALPALAAIFISQQVVFLVNNYEGARNVDRIAVGSWIVLTVVLLLALATGGGWIYPKSVRDLANDETTRAHRSQALAAGFWAAMLGALVLFIVDLFEPVDGRDAAHIVLTLGIAVALMMFGALEKRAIKDG
jgi:hypothetical protein